MNSIVISDTSCLIALDKIGCLDLLQKVFTPIYTTKIVAEEFQDPLPAWVLIRKVNNSSMVKHLELILDSGEASAISLALETENSVLIIDEKKGRKVAMDLNVNIIGTLKVLLIAKNHGVINSVKDIINELQNHSFRFNKAVVEEVLRLANE